MGYFVDTDGAYYEGDNRGQDQEVTQRPSHLYAWSGSAWAISNGELKKAKKADIAAHEFKDLMNRGVREGMIKIAEKEAAALGVPLQVLYAQNEAYKLFKDADDEIAAIRAEIKALP